MQFKDVKSPRLTPYQLDALAVALEHLRAILIDRQALLFRLTLKYSLVLAVKKVARPKMQGTILRLAR